MKEVDENEDIHTGKEWFHNSITKDEALNLLTAGLYQLKSCLNIINCGLLMNL